MPVGTYRWICIGGYVPVGTGEYQWVPVGAGGVIWGHQGHLINYIKAYLGKLILIYPNESLPKMYFGGFMPVY